MKTKWIVLGLLTLVAMFALAACGTPAAVSPTNAPPTAAVRGAHDSSRCGTTHRRRWTSHHRAHPAPTVERTAEGGIRKSRQRLQRHLEFVGARLYPRQCLCQSVR